MACLDLGGSILFLGFVITLVIALQWAGTIYAWSDVTIITLLVLSGVMLISFVAWEFYLQDSSPMLTLSFFKNRSIIGACVIAFSCSFILIAGVSNLRTYTMRPLLKCNLRRPSCRYTGRPLEPIVPQVPVLAGVLLPASTQLAECPSIDLLPFVLGIVRGPASLGTSPG